MCVCCCLVASWALLLMLWCVREEQIARAGAARIAFTQMLGGAPGGTPHGAPYLPPRASQLAAYAVRVGKPLSDAADVGHMTHAAWEGRQAPR